MLPEGRKEGNVLFNDALNTFYLRLYGVTHMVKDHLDSEREETQCHHMGYSFRLAARVLLYASSHRQDNTYHGLFYTSCGALAGMIYVTNGIQDFVKSFISKDGCIAIFDLTKCYLVDYNQQKSFNIKVRGNGP